MAYEDVQPGAEFQEFEEVDSISDNKKVFINFSRSPKEMELIFITEDHSIKGESLFEYLAVLIRVRP